METERDVDVILTIINTLIKVKISTIILQVTYTSYITSYIHVLSQLNIHVVSIKICTMTTIITVLLSHKSVLFHPLWLLLPR